MQRGLAKAVARQSRQISTSGDHEPRSDERAHENTSWLVARLCRRAAGRSAIDGANDRAQRLAQFGGGHVVMETRQQCQTIGDRRHVLGGSDGLDSRVVAAFAQQLYGREDVIGLSTIRIAPEAFQDEHETMDTLAKKVTCRVRQIRHDLTTIATLMSIQAFDSARWYADSKNIDRNRSVQITHEDLPTL